MKVRRQPAVDAPVTWWPITTVVAIWLAAAGLLGAGIFLVFGRLAGHDWYPWNDKSAPDLFDVTRSTVTAAGLLGGAVVAAIAVRRQRSHEIELRNAQLTLENERDANATDRYTKAVEQLGHANVSVRMGGIYALERVSHDSARDASTISEVLSAYARRDGENASSREGVVAVDVEAVVRVLARRPLGDEQRPTPPARLAGVHLREARLDNAHLAEAELKRATLVEADLTDASLQFADLSEADLSLAVLSGAQCSGALFPGANLVQAKLIETNLNAANLADADLQGADLALADLTHAVLVRVNLTHANLNGADLTAADLTGADLSGANLRGATLTGTDMGRATLARADLTHAVYERDEPDAAPPPRGWRIGADNRLERQEAKRRRSEPEM